MTAQDGSYERVAEAVDQLRSLTKCRCRLPWTARDLHERSCVADYREDVEVLVAALPALRKDR